MGAPFLSSALLVSHASKNHATLKHADSKLIDSRLTRECSKEAAHLKEGPSKLQVEQHWETSSPDSSWLWQKCPHYSYYIDYYFSADLTWARTLQKAPFLFCQVQDDLQKDNYILSTSIRHTMNVATTELVDHAAVGIVAGVCRNVWDCQTKLSDVASDTGRCNSLQGFFGILSVMFYGVIYHIWWSIWL